MARARAGYFYKMVAQNHGSHWKTKKISYYPIMFIEEPKIFKPFFVNLIFLFYVNLLKNWKVITIDKVVILFMFII